MNWKAWVTNVTYPEAARGILGLLVLLFLLRWAVGRVI